jgi:hypothetical protein
VIAPSGEQVEIAAGDQQAVIVEVDGGLRSSSASDRELVDRCGVDEMSSSGRRQALIPWLNQLQVWQLRVRRAPQLGPSERGGTPQRDRRLRPLGRLDGLRARAVRDRAETRPPSATGLPLPAHAQHRICRSDESGASKLRYAFGGQVIGATANVGVAPGRTRGPLHARSRPITLKHPKGPATPMQAVMAPPVHPRVRPHRTGAARNESENMMSVQHRIVLKGMLAPRPPRSRPVCALRASLRNIHLQVQAGRHGQVQPVELA